MNTEDHKNTQGDEQGNGKEWQAIAEQMASHSTTNDKGETVYLGQDLPEDQQAKVIERGFDNLAEEPRGATDDSTISEETYPQLDGESQEDYERRLAELQGLTDLAAEDAKMEDESRLAGKLGSVGIAADDEKKSELDPFWKEHEDTFKEAEELGAPLDAETFEKEDYKLMRDPDDDKVHVWAPTPAYKDWQKNGEKTRRPRHYEDVQDKQSRLEREEQKRAREEEERKEKDAYEARVEAVAKFVTPEEIKKITQEMFPDTKFTKYRMERMKEDIPRLVVEYLGKRQEALRKGDVTAEDAYREARQRKMEQGSMDAPSKEELAEGLAGSLSTELRVKNKHSGWNSYRHRYNFEYTYETPIVAQAILNRAQTELLSGELQETVEELTPEKEKFVLESLVAKGVKEGTLFFKAGDLSREQIVEKIQELGLDVNDQSLRRQILANGYKEDENNVIPEVFALKELVAEMMDAPSENGLVFDRERSRFGVRNINGEIRYLSDDVSSAAEEKRREMLATIAEAEKDNPELVSAIEERKKAAVEGANFDLGRTLIGYRANEDRRQELLEEMMNREKVKWTFGSSTDLIKVPEELAAYEEFLPPADVLKMLYPDREVEFTGKMESARSALLECLATGITDPSYSDPDNNFLKIFETDFYKQYKDEIGLDFSDPEVFNKAFDGFMRVLQATKGEKSSAAEWYFENVFVTNPDKFDFMLHSVWADEDTPRGLKNKIGSFRNNNEAYKDYVIQKKREEARKAAEEAEALDEGLAHMTRRSLSHDDVKRLINRYKKELVEKIKGYGLEPVEGTFSDESYTSRVTPPRPKPEIPAYEGEGAPEDFGLRKVMALNEWYLWIKNNIPGAFDNPEGEDSVDWFMDGFSGESVEDYDPDDPFANINIDNQNSYIGFKFNFRGKQCVIMESFNNESAMYVMRLDKDEDFTDLFLYSKLDAIRNNDQRIARVPHVDIQDYEELGKDKAIRNAMLYLGDGDKKALLLRTYGSGERGRVGFSDYMQRNFPDEAIGIDSIEERFPGSLAGYRAWQERQDRIQRRLTEARNRGGESAYQEELRRIAEEDYLRLMLGGNF